MDVTPRRAERRLAWLALGVTVCLFVLFNLNLRGIGSRDTRVNEYVGFALAVDGRPDLDRFPWLVEAGQARHYVQIVDGHARSSYPLLPSMLAAPLYRLAVGAGLMDSTAPRSYQLEAVGKIVASGLVALACGFVCLGLAGPFGTTTAVTVSLAAGMASSLWSSASQALWSHAPAVACLAVALAAVFGVAAGSPHRARLLVVAGFFVALAVSARVLLVVFPLGLTVGLFLSREPRRHVWAFVAGGLVAAAATAALNLSVFGHALGGAASLYTTGVNGATHGVASAWGTNWFAGLAGVFVSPNRGLLVFTPVALVAVAGIPRAWRHGALWQFGLVLPTLAFVGVWAQYAVWWGGHSYGSRLSADIVVPLAFLAAGVTSRWALLPRLLRSLVVVALTWSLAVQAIGVFFYPNGNWNAEPVDVDQAHARLWDWHDSQIRRTLGAGPYHRRY